MKKENPFAGLKAGWLDLAGAVSEICADGISRRLDWKSDGSGSFTADDELAVFTLSIEKLSSGIKLKTAARWKKALPEHFTFTPVTFPAFGIEHAFFVYIGKYILKKHSCRLISRHTNVLSVVLCSNTKSIAVGISTQNNIARNNFGCLVTFV